MTTTEEAAISRLEKIRQLERAKSRLKMGGGPERAEKQHSSGKLTARERVDLLVDRDTFQEAGLFAAHKTKYFGMAGKEIPAAGGVTGRGYVDGRLLPPPRQDFTVAGGSARAVEGQKNHGTKKGAAQTG